MSNKTNIWCEKEIKELIAAVAQTKSNEEVEKIFDIVLTPREINDMARRLKIKRMLEEGATYSEISTSLRVSPVIISRVSNQIGFGFRRLSAEIVETGKHRTKKPIRRYKGSVPIHRIFG